jgi:GAF domain-containing protein
MRATVHIKLGKMRQAKNEVDNRMNLLGEIAQEVNSSAEIDKSLVNILEKLIKAVQAETGDLFLPAKQYDSLTAASIKQISDLYLSQSAVDGSSITTAALETGQPALVNNVQGDSRFSTELDQGAGQPTTSILCAPLTIGNDFTCVMRLFNKVSPGFTSDDLNLLVSAANIISVALKNNYLNLLLQTANQDSGVNIKI